MSEKVWADLRRGLQLVRKITDELWKVWRWFGIGLLGFVAYERTGEMSTLAFGIMMSFVGVISLFSWIFEGNTLGITEKGKNSWLLIQATLFVALLFISAYFAIWLWATVTLLALPVFGVPH